MRSEKVGRHQDHIDFVSHGENLGFYSERDGKPLKGSKQRRDVMWHVLQRIRSTTQQECK